MKRIGVIVCIALALAFALGGSTSAMDAPATVAQREGFTTHQVQAPAVSQPAKMPPSTASTEKAVHCDTEAKCLAKLRGIADRSGQNLNLKLENGSTKSFASSKSCEDAGESCEQTSLVDYRPSQHLFVLSAKYYESNASIIVSRRTGETFSIDAGAPYFSPDGKRFVVVAVSEQDGINELAIYNTGSFPPVREWSHNPKDWKTFKFVAWNGNDQVKLRVFEKDTEASISRSSSGWKLTQAGD